MSEMDDRPLAAIVILLAATAPSSAGGSGAGSCGPVVNGKIAFESNRDGGDPRTSSS